MQVEELQPIIATAPAIVREILNGLRSIPKRISSKFLYDQRGSELFEEICGLPEYYPTRTETAIMEKYAGEMIAAIGRRAVLIELGSGSSTKTRMLLDKGSKLAAYVPVDISGDFLADSTDQLRNEYPELRIEPVAADYTRSIPLPDSVSNARRKVVYFPGSTFGNFYPSEGLAFLKQIRSLVGPNGGLLIGLDWRKDRARLEAAYNDSLGITAAFNLNILSNVNRLANGNFDESDFSHYACFDEQESRIEIYVVSRRAHSVSLADERFVFEADEAVLTEVSYKYRPEDFVKLAAEAGFSLYRDWSDSEHLFGVLYLSAS